VKILQAIDKFLIHCEEFLSALAMLSMCLVVFAAIVCRYTLSISFASGEEIARYMMVWCIFLGIIGATRKNAHVRVEAFVDFLPALPRRLIIFLSELITIGTFCAMFYFAIELTGRSMGPRAQLTPLTRIPYWYLYVSLAIGFGMSALRGVQIIVKEFLRHTTQVPGLRK
jgi:TRAP-type C4-dicarboxylate transport system permease small subunit